MATSNMFKKVVGERVRGATSVKVGVNTCSV